MPGPMRGFANGTKRSDGRRASIGRGEVTRKLPFPSRSSRRHFESPWIGSEGKGLNFSLLGVGFRCAVHHRGSPAPSGAPRRGQTKRVVARGTGLAGFSGGGYFLMRSYVRFGDFDVGLGARDLPFVSLLQSFVHRVLSLLMQSNGNTRWSLASC